MSDQAPLELVVETHLLRQCRNFGFLCWKYVSPARDGVPDRVVITKATTCFVEVKRPGEKLRPLQEETAARMRRAGAQVYVVDSLAQVDQLVAHLQDQVDLLPSTSLSQGTSSGLTQHAPRRSHTTEALLLHRLNKMRGTSTTASPAPD